MTRKLFAKVSPLIAGIAVAKWVTFCMGLAMFFLMSDSGVGLVERWAIVFWYTTLGAIVGMSNAIVRVPIVDLSLPWWIRGPAVSAWMCLMVVLFAGDRVQQLMWFFHVSKGALTSPYWFVGDGLIIGLIAGMFSTRIERSQSVSYAKEA